MNSIDILVNNYFSLVRDSTLTGLMYILTIFFDVSIYTFYIFVLVALFIALTTSVKHSILFVSSTFFTGMLVYLLKEYFSVTRPTDALFHTFGHSFPSFHATIATVFFIILMYIFDGHLRSYMRIIFNSFSILSIFAVAFSRVYLGVHWFSDVFFGIILGSLIGYSSIVIFRAVINMRGPASMVK